MAVGTITTELFNSTETKPYLRIEAEISFFASNGWWEVQQKFLSPLEMRGTVESCKLIEDGVRIRSRFPAATNDDVLLPAEALPIQFPPPEKSGLLICWLSLCPKAALPFKSANLIARFTHSKVYNHQDNVGEFEAKYSDPHGAFLSYLAVTNNGIAVTTDGKAIPYPSPYNRGFLEFEYRVQSSTNVMGYIVPISAQIRRYSPKPAGISASDTVIKSVTELHVVQISFSSAPPSTSDWPQTYFGVDRRPRGLSQDLTVNYVVTNDQWVAATSSSIARLTKIVAESRKTSQPPAKPKKILIIFALAILPGGLLVTFFLFLKRSNT